MVGLFGGDVAKMFTVGTWFVLNISIGTLTKWILLHGKVCVSGQRCQAWDFPLTMTVVHLLMSQAVCRVYLFGLRKESPAGELRGMKRVRKIGPLAACFAASVGLGNLSLSYIYPSLKQMVGACSPLVTVLMSIVFQNRHYNWWTWVAMPLISGGLWFCVQDEINFSLFGVVVCVGAMVTRSMKSIVQANLLTEKVEPVTLLYYMAPYSAILVMLMALVTEGFEPFLLLARGAGELVAQWRDPSPAEEARGSTGLLRLLLLLLLSGLNACLLNIFGFIVTRCTGAVMLQVLGSVKSSLGIAVSVAVLRNPVTPSQAFGSAVCIFGAWIYDRFGGPLKVIEKAR